MRQLKITYQITARDSDSLEKYLNDLARLPMLAPEEEVKLATLAQEGNTEALQRLVEANLRFVVSVAKQFQFQGLSLADLINEGNMGLIKAAHRFDASRGFKFISYAVWWIRQSIMQALLHKSRLVRRPVNKESSYSKISAAFNKFEQENSREPSLMELASITEVKPSVLQDMIFSRGKHLSFDAPIGEDVDAVSLGDITEDNNISSPDNQLDYESMKMDIQMMLSKLTDREAGIISCYYGLSGQSRMSLEDIGDRYNLTRERVRQVKDRALRKLRRFTLSGALKSYLG